MTIPDGVTFIGNNAFDGCTSLTDMTIPASVTSVGRFAFDGCRESLINLTIGSQECLNEGIPRLSLKSVTILDGITEIPDNAFQNGMLLPEITLPDGITKIGSSAFEGCTSLKEITIPDGVKSIGMNAFKDCKSLADITIPDSVTGIGGYAFSGCESLTEITLPDCSTGIYPFLGCTSLTDVYFGGTVAKWSRSQGVNNNYAFNIHYLKDDERTLAELLDELWRGEPQAPLFPGIVAELKHRGYTEGEINAMVAACRAKKTNVYGDNIPKPGEVFATPTPPTAAPA